MTTLRCALIFLLAASAAAQAIPGKFYEYYTVARTGSTYTNLGAGPSISEDRRVAFQATASNGTGLWLGTGATAATNFNAGLTNPSSDFYAPSVQVNRSGFVVSEDRITSTTPATTSIRLFNSAFADTFNYSGRGGPGRTYDAVFANPAVNINGDVVFTAFHPTPQKFLVYVPNGGSAVEVPISSGNPKPMIADNGKVVIQVGGTGSQSNQQIRVYPSGLGAPVIVADTSGNWLSLDNDPGISRDGRMIAFQGNINTVGATAIGTTAGPGIFVAIDENSNNTFNRILRLTGGQVENVQADLAANKGNKDGVCDPGEICVTAAELGYDINGAPITFSSYGVDARVGVANVDFGAVGIDDDTFVVSFIGTPTSASRPNPFNTSIPLLFSASQGLWTIRVDVQHALSAVTTRVYHPTTPIPVVQVGDKLGADIVTGLGVYDPIANAGYDESGAIRTMRRGDHRVAFWASTNNGQAIYRANHLDSDQDGLLDHWETAGIDMNQDGFVDLSLSAMGADPFHRDLFLQVDAALGFKYQPQPGVFSSDTPGVPSYFENNFLNAEALTGALYGATLDGSAPAGIPRGITPHVDAGPNNDLLGFPLSINLAGATPRGGNAVQMPGAPGTAPDLIYYGLSGSINVPGLNALSFEDVKRTYLGNFDKDARELAFHYVVLAPFQDFKPYVTLGQGNPASPFVGAAAATQQNIGYLELSGALPGGIVSGDFVMITTGPSAGFVTQITGFATNTVTGNPLIQLTNSFATPPNAGDSFVVFDGSTGLAETQFAAQPDFNSLPGNDVIVSLHAMPLAADGIHGSSCDQWQTVMHELGHTLGLRHGGIDHVTSATVKGTAYKSMMSYTWQMSCTLPYQVVGYSQAGDPTFDDFANLRMDMSNVMFNVGNSLGLGLGSGSFGNYIHQNPEPNYSLHIAHSGPLDVVNPAVQITSPTAGAGVSGSVTVMVTATDNQAIDHVTVRFDANGSGVIDVGEAVTAVAMGGNVYKAVFPALTGAAGVRAIRAIAYDPTANFASTQVNVTIGGSGTAVPNVVGLTQAAATNAITGAGLVLGTVSSAISNTVASGNVISESPAAGTSVSAGAAVNLVVSVGATCTYVLSPVSQTIGAAGGAGGIAVSAPAGCAWTAVASAPWVTITPPASGNGNGNVALAIALNSGLGRVANVTIGGQVASITQTGTLAQYNVGFFQPSGPTWVLDSNGSGGYDAGDNVFAFAGQPGAIAVVGDWNGNGKTKVGYYLNGFWVLDYNGNGVYDGTGPGGDKFYAFGGSGAAYVPVVGDWNGDGRTKIGFYNNGSWALDTNGNGTFDGVGLGQDSFYGFGGNGVGEVPVLGDWNGDHRTKVGFFYQGKWALDYDGNGTFTLADKYYTTFPYAVGDKPVTGDWTGDGKTKIGIFRGGFWILDQNNNGTYDGVGPGQDKFYGFGGNTGEIPLVADWNGSGTSKIGLYINGFWVLDFNGNGSYDGTGPGGDRFIAFGGQSGNQPIIGRW